MCAMKTIIPIVLMWEFTESPLKNLSTITSGDFLIPIRNAVSNEIGIIYLYICRYYSIVYVTILN